MVLGCQVCLGVINKPLDAIYLSSYDGNSNTVPLVEKLSDCVPELMLHSVENPVICNLCFEALSSAYLFKQKCLESQQKIYEYLQETTPATLIDMGEIAVHYRNINNKVKVVEPLPKENVKGNEKSKMPHKCSQCSFTCIDRCVIRYHKILHQSKNAPYKCDECFFIFPTTLLLLEHLVTHTNENPFACTVCDYTTSTYNDLNEHTFIHRNAFQCKVCWRRFVDMQKLDNHSINHDYEVEVIKYQCGWCDYKTNSTNFLTYHVNNEHEMTFNCDKCFFKCRVASRLTQHLEIRHKKNTETPKIYDNVNFLLRNSVPQDDVTILADNDKMNTEHSTKQIYDNSTFQNHSFICFDCNITFLSANSLNRHFQKRSCKQHSNATSKTKQVVHQPQQFPSQFSKPNFQHTIPTQVTPQARKLSVKVPNKASVVAPTKSQNTVLQCEICELRYYKKEALIRHMTIYAKYDSGHLNLLKKYNVFGGDFNLDQDSTLNTGDNIESSGCAVANTSTAITNRKRVRNRIRKRKQQLYFKKFKKIEKDLSQATNSQQTNAITVSDGSESIEGAGVIVINDESPNLPSSSPNDRKQSDKNTGENLPEPIPTVLQLQENNRNAEIINTQKTRRRKKVRFPRDNLLMISD